jgi:Rap guanine nucleotide exchange factor 2
MVSMDTLDDAGALNASVYPPPPHNSMSNPDLLRDSFEESKPTSEYPEHVLKVYKADQTFKYLLVHKETTAHEVVMLSLQEFGITETRCASNPGSMLLFLKKCAYVSSIDKTRGG